MGMAIYILKRLSISLLMLLVASFIVFAGVRSTVDPTASVRLSNDSANAVKAIEEKLHLNEPIYKQYWYWISGVVQGDLGVGDRDGEEVTTKLKRGMSGTFELALWGGLLAGCLGITFGVVAAIRRNHPIDYALSGLSILGIAIPTFWFAYILMEIFSIKLPELFGTGPWFYVNGNADGSFGRDASGIWSMESIVEYIKHMAMPVMVLAIQLLSSWSRYQRSSMIESLQSDYIRTAHAKGMSKFRVYFRHAFRNAQLPMVTVIALDLGALVQGLVITEFVFAISGMGRVFTRAFDNGDATTLAGWTLVVAAFVIIGNLVADLLLPVIDPRIRTK